MYDIVIFDVNEIILLKFLFAFVIFVRTNKIIVIKEYSILYQTHILSFLLTI